MARGRFVSKAISLDERVNALSDDTVRLLFTWLITHLDCEGRMHGDAQTVKSVVFPRRKLSPAKIEKYLKELQKNELIFRYSVNGNDYLCMKTFEKHQPGLQKDREAQSQIPPIPPELLQSSSRLTLPQVKEQVKVKEETKVEGSSCSKEDVIEVYKREIMGFHEEEALSEYTEGEIEAAINIFTASWVVDAIFEAVKHNKPTWVYIAGILKNWKKDGKDAVKTPTAKADPDKFIKGKYGHMIRR